MKKILSALALLISLSSCGITVKGGVSDDPKNGVDGPGQTPAELNGMTPDQAYGQFVDKSAGSCDSHDFMFTPLGVFEVSLGKSANGYPTYAEVVVFMQPNNRYWARYEEYEEGPCEIEGGANVCHLTQLRYEEFEEAWYIDADRLVLRNIGRSSYLTYNNRPAVMLTFDDNFFGAAAGKSKIGWLSRTNIGARGETINQHCGR